jgi:hypothetical protein
MTEFFSGFHKMSEQIQLTNLRPIWWYTLNAEPFEIAVVCINENNTELIVRITGFTPYLYFEYKNVEDVAKLHHQIQKLLGDLVIPFTPNDFLLTRPLYYFCEPGQKLMYKFSFRNEDARRKAVQIIFEHGKVHEINIEPISQLRASRKLRYCSIFNCNGIKVINEVDKLCTVPEYVCSYLTLTPSAELSDNDK